MEKQQGTTKRAIYVVFDNSGSMYGDGNKAWSQATYAMEVFAAMMNYESGDVMPGFPMHDITTDAHDRYPGTSYYRNPLSACMVLYRFRNSIPGSR